MAASGIRVSRIPEDISENQLKIYFSNPRNNGGHVSQILYPLADNAAVILFDDPAVAARIVKDQHQLEDEDVIVATLPKQIYNRVVVEVDKPASMFLNLNYSTVDELEYVGEVNVKFDYGTETYTLQGTWYQMEWTLHHIDLGMRANQAEGRGHSVAMEGNDGHRMVAKQHSIPAVKVKHEPGTELPHPSKQRQGEQQQQHGARASQGYPQGHRARSAQELQHKRNRTLSDEDLQPNSRDDGSKTPEKADSMDSGTDNDAIEEQKLFDDTLGQGKPDYQAFGDTSSQELKRKSQTKAPTRNTEESRRHNDELNTAGGGEDNKHKLRSKLAGNKMTDRDLLAGSKATSRDQHTGNGTTYQSLLSGNKGKLQDQLSGNKATDRNQLAGNKVTDWNQATGKRTTYQSLQDQLAGNKVKTQKPETTAAVASGSDDYDASWYQKLVQAKGVRMKDQLSGNKATDRNQLAGNKVTDRNQPTGKRTTYQTLCAGNKAKLQDQLAGNKVKTQKPEANGVRMKDFKGLSQRKPRPLMRKMPKMTSGIDVAQTDFGEVPLSFEFTTDTGLKVKVTKDNIVKQKTDAIVNSTSPDLVNDYAVSRAIVRAARPTLQMECQAHVQTHGPLNYSDVMHTCAGGQLDRHVKYVLHTAGPAWKEDKADFVTHLLVCTYLNCLQYTQKLSLHTVAMPLISAGAWGFPLDVCIQAFYDAVLLHCTQPDTNSHLKQVHLVAFDPDTTMATIVLIQSLCAMDATQAQHVALERYHTGRIQYNVGVGDLKLPRDGLTKKVKVRTPADTGVKENDSKKTEEGSTHVHVRASKKTKEEMITTHVHDGASNHMNVVKDAKERANIKQEDTSADDCQVGPVIPESKIKDEDITPESGVPNVGNKSPLSTEIDNIDDENASEREAEEESSVYDNDSDVESNGNIYQLEEKEESLENEMFDATKVTSTKQSDEEVEPGLYAGEIELVDEAQQVDNASKMENESRVDLKTTNMEPQEEIGDNDETKDGHFDDGVDITKDGRETEEYLDGYSTPTGDNTEIDSTTVCSAIQVRGIPTEKESLSFTLSHFAVAPDEDNKLSLSECEVDGADVQTLSSGEFEDAWSMIPPQKSGKTNDTRVPSPVAADKEITFDNEYTDSENDLDLVN